MGLLRPDGPFIAVPVLAEVFPQGLDTVPDGTLDKLRLAWAEVREAPDLLTPAWCGLVLADLLGYTPQMLAEGPALPEDLRSGPLSSELPGGEPPGGGPLSGGPLPGGPRAGTRLRPDAVASGPRAPDGTGRAERLLIYRRPAGEPLTAATRNQSSAAGQAAELCRRRGVPLALLTNGTLWVLVHARPGEPVTTAVFDADMWLEERALLRAFASLLGARRVLPPPRQAGGSHSASLAALFARSAEAQAEVTGMLGTQVREAVEMLVGELSRLDRESGGALLGEVPPREVYRGALTVMMRLVFLLYAEERRLLPVDSELYATAYSVTALYDQLRDERNLHGDEVAGRRAAAWPRLLATFAAIHGGCEHDEMRIPPYGGGMFDPARYPWLDRVAVTDRVTGEMLGALLVLRRRGGAAERLSYKGLAVEQIGHVYEGLLEFSCLRVTEPYLGLTGKLEPEIPLAELERKRERDGFADYLAKACGTSAASPRKALDNSPIGEATLDAACDNDKDLARRVWPLRGLLRRDLRGRPTVFPAGSLIVTQTGDRRATGTHYTPRKLAEEIVEHTLAPLCYSPGPADGAGPGDRQVRPAGELLGLKVLDPAMGSGAFLVAACSYLSERLVQAWERDGYPDAVLDVLGPRFDRDDARLEARRLVAARCLYGVDRDEAAVELGKLSLWLVTLARDKPFSFLDHALRWGDSLVGLTSESQVTAFHLDPAAGHRINARLSGTINEIAGPIMARIRDLREQIEAEPVRDHRQGDALTARLAEADRLTARLRGAADAVAAAALSTAGQSDDAFDDRLTSLSEQVQHLLIEDVAESPLEHAFREQINAWLQGPRAEPIRPLHWPLEFPEVMARGGFDAVVSNPPFVGGKKVSGALGTDFREYLKQRVARDKPGNADLCSYFLLRDLSVARRGRVGIVATNTIAQGDTREVGLDQAVDIGWTIYRADKSRPWPGTAAVEVSLLWVGHAGQHEQCVLDGQAIRAITPSLDPESRVRGNPYRLTANTDQAFIGSYVLGTGFILDREDAEALIAKDPRNKAILFPYLTGEDLNSRWDCSASRWIINFHDWPAGQAEQYGEIFSIIVRKVKPQRDLLPDYKRRVRENWWLYEYQARNLYSAIADLDRVLVIALVSRLVMPAVVPTGQVFSHKLGVFATDKYAHLALFSSSLHSLWAWRTSSTMKADLNYSPSDAFETFSQPRPTERMDHAGEALDTFRRKVMTQRKERSSKEPGIGLTATYNLVHDEATADGDIVRLREIHVEIDEVVREAYALDEEREPAIREFEAEVASAPLPSWREIDLDHGFHETRQGTRFTIGPRARADVLDKLLALNHYRYRQEVERGLRSRKGRATPGKRAGSRRGSGGAPSHGPEEALF